MASTTLIDNEFATLVYHTDTKVVHHHFHKFIHGQPFRDVLMKGLEQMERYGATKWLSDDRGNSALPADDTAWSLEEWTPRMLKAGWKYWAIVLPEKVVGQMNMKRFIAMYSDKGVTAQVFATPEEALAWLAQQKN